MAGAMQPDVYNIHHVASALRDIKKEVAKMNRSGTYIQPASEVRDILDQRGPRTKPRSTVPGPLPAERSALRRLYDRFTGR